MFTKLFRSTLSNLCWSLSSQSIIMFINRDMHSQGKQWVRLEIISITRERERDRRWFLFRLFTCISRDELQYFVFDYLNEWKNVDVINNGNLQEQMKDFLEGNFFPIENLVLPERKILGPIKYNRAQLLSIASPSVNSTFNDTLQTFCFNQSSIRKINRFRCSIR